GAWPYRRRQVRLSDDFAIDAQQIATEDFVDVRAGVAALLQTLLQSTEFARTVERIDPVPKMSPRGRREIARAALQLQVFLLALRWREILHGCIASDADVIHAHETDGMLEVSHEVIERDRWGRADVGPVRREAHQPSHGSHLA